MSNHRGLRKEYNGTIVHYRYDIEEVPCVQPWVEMDDGYAELRRPPPFIRYPAFRVLLDGSNMGMFDTVEQAEKWIEGQEELIKRELY